MKPTPITKALVGERDLRAFMVDLNRFCRLAGMAWPHLDDGRRDALRTLTGTEPPYTPQSLMSFSTMWDPVRCADRRLPRDLCRSMLYFALEKLAKDAKEKGIEFRRLAKRSIAARRKASEVHYPRP